MANLDPVFAKQLAESDQEWASAIEQLRWAFSTSDDAGQALGRSVREAMQLIARSCDNPAFLLVFLQKGMFLALEEINREPDE
jgi:hypothetical protein